MSRTHRLATRELAAWWRARQVPVLYPIDLGDEETYDVAVPTDAPALDLLRHVVATARVSVFLLHVAPHLAPQTVVRSAAAVVGGDDAVVVDVVGDKAEIREIGTSEAVQAIGDLLPELGALDVPDTELAEADWAGIVALLAAEPDEATRRSRLHARGVPDRLAAAMIAGASAPVTVGTVGVQVFVDGTAHLGPSLLSWQELDGGALLTHLHAPRRPGPARVELGPYRVPELIRALPETVSTAQYRLRR